MKYKIIILLLISNLIFSQKGLIKYGYIEAFANGNAKGPEYVAYMIFNKEVSYYVTAKDSLEKAEKINAQKTFNNDDDGSATIHNGLKVSPQGDQVVNNLKTKTLTSNLLYRNQIYVEENTPIIKWTFSKESKKIGTFNCKKATANFRGRNYNAWYTTDIPVSYGPWKLNGLPGLILEAYDSSKNVYWYFESIDYPTKNKANPTSIRKSKTEKTVTFKVYNDFKKIQLDEIIRIKEKNILLKKQMPDIDFMTPKLDQMFIECE